MDISKTLLVEFRSNLQGILRDNSTELQLNGIIKVCHAVAITYLKGKIASRRLNLEFVKLNLSDVAYDCIADLFLRDDQNSVVQLKGYFGSLQVESLSDEALIAHLRRLVCSKVNQGIFRLYNEIDPALGKVLRNLKLTILALKNFDELEWFGETYITPVSCDALLHLPNMPEEVLDAELRQHLCGKERIPELMSQLALCLRGQERYSRAVPLMVVARTFRSIYGHPTRVQFELPVVEAQLMKEDTAATIRAACEEVKKEMYPKYVGRKRVSGTNFEYYFAIIERRLQANIIAEDGEDLSYFKEFRKFVPSLTKDKYGKAHKAILEYLGRIVQTRFRDRVRST